MTAVWPENTSPSSDALKSSSGSLFVNVSESDFNFLVMQTLTALKSVYLSIYCICACKKCPFIILEYMIEYMLEVSEGLINKSFCDKVNKKN